MGTYRIPGPTCEVRNWFVDPIDPGTMARAAMAPPGILDGEDPQIRALGIRFWHPAFNFSPLGRAQGEFAEFEQRVLNAHIVRSEVKKRQNASGPIPTADLMSVEGDFKLRSAAATKCKLLLQKARADLNNAKVRGDAFALKVSRIGLTSAYRSPEYDEELWRRYFRSKYYRINLSKLMRKSQFVVGSHRREQLVNAAAEELVGFIRTRKAAPGFSNHTKGIAVDFITHEGGATYAAETGKSDAELKMLNQRYEKTWFYKWLDAHKSEFGAARISSEAWHWEFR